MTRSPESAAHVATVTSSRTGVRQALHASGLFAAGFACACPVVAAAGPWPARFELSHLGAGMGLEVLGEQAHPYSGFAVGGVGDINGDGFDDVGIGTDPSRYYVQLGRAYVVFGSVEVASGGPLTLSELDGSNGFVLDSSDVEGDYLGMSLDGAGDFNGDGFEDLILGLPKQLDPSLRAFVVFGGPGVGAGGVVDVWTLDPAEGFALVAVQIQDRAGASVRGAGDVNGDGMDDLVVHAPHYAHYRPFGYDLVGRAYVVFGTDTPFAGGRLPLASLDGSNGFVLAGSGDALLSSETANSTVDGAVDVNGDGFDDLILGGMFAGSTGRSYVVFGATGVGGSGIVNVSALDGQNGFALISSLAGTEELGCSVAGLDDINGDGYDDLIVGDHHYDPAGASYVVFGGLGVGTGGSIDVAKLDGTNGFAFLGAGPVRFFSGDAVSAAGDLDSDGLGDVLIGAPTSFDQVFNETYVLFGATDIGSGGNLTPGMLNGNDGFVVVGEDESEYIGGAVAAGGDVNGDGRDDFLIGAPFADVRRVEGFPRLPAGKSYVILGGPPDNDADGLYDGEDNCMYVANADQRDTDGDAFGNLCDPDLNGDLIVNFVDLGLFKPLVFSADPNADFDGNGVINFADLGIMKQLFFRPPGPSGYTD